MYIGHSDLTDVTLFAYSLIYATADMQSLQAG